ncbi:hypothetical protein GCM10012275_24250 [Longimycelium tulufanense]|uniref:Uncharacterized protein n=1 Tax=Longimycelium tulufanense TaxID=907463 RepID=A0A8J3CDU0_9PSEU|nr:hypothetical protein GCM10012275_24250 [Longimycelium tulufanense]
MAVGWMDAAVAYRVRGHAGEVSRTGTILSGGYARIRSGDGPSTPVGAAGYTHGRRAYGACGCRRPADTRKRGTP